MRDAEETGLAGEGRLRWFHWLVMLMSLALTFTAWWIARGQNLEKNRARFEREAAQLVDLVAERMRTYADALNAGVGMIRTHGVPTRSTWRTYAEALRVEEKYPGINGFGIIEQVDAEHLPALIAEQRREMPDFKVHPPVEGDHHLPIVYVEPEAENRKAIGLDMAHEKNRYTAALQARDSGEVRMTGPIVLVQDARRTAGFLLFAPYYESPQPTTEAQRRARFQGMVYAPFIVAKLLRGTLERTRRQIEFSIRDAGVLLYDEHSDDIGGSDPDPMFHTALPLNLYGRAWSFDIRTTTAFRESSGVRQPAIILFVGVAIDLMLLIFFLLVARRSRRAHERAAAATRDLKSRQAALEQSNARLERFASVAAHDLREPSRKVVSFLGLVERRIGDALDEKSRVYMNYAVDGALRMRTLVDSILAISRVGQRIEKELLDVGAIARTQAEEVFAEVEDVEWRCGDLPAFRANRTNVGLLLKNLLSNAVKYRGPGPLRVEVGSDVRDGVTRIFVRDNGVGIEPAYRDQVFEMFRRLHGGKVPGAGIGLALCEMVVSTWEGRIGIEDGAIGASGTPGVTVWFAVPDAGDSQEG